MLDACDTDLLTPLPQSEAYARTCAALGVDLQTRRLWRDGVLDGLCNLQHRRMKLIGHVRLISRGPVMRPDLARDDWVQRLMSRACGPVLLNAPQADVDCLRAHGAVRLFSPAQIGLLPLGASGSMRKALRQKWRNRLNRAEQSGITVSAEPFRRDRHIHFLNSEARQQKARGYRNYPLHFVLAFAQENPGQTTMVIARKGSAPLGAMLFLGHGGMVTYQMGIVEKAGRACQASQLMMWRAMTWHADRGYRMLDLGRVDTGAGLAHFKLGTGAEAHDLGGTWLYHPSLARAKRASRRWLPRRAPQEQLRLGHGSVP